MKVTPLVASRFRSDGGAMFGLVPKPIWSRLIPPNENNGIPQNANCLLVELADGRKGLVDTGCGDPAWYSEKQRSIQGLDPEWLLPEALGAHDTELEDIAFVILSHLHWDHVGGVGRMGEDGEPRLSFPNAQHFVHTAEWRDAGSKDPLLGQSYPPESLAALQATQSDSVLLVTDAAPDVLPGIRLARSGGHTYGHCAVVLSDEDLVVNHPDAGALGAVDTLVYAGDVCPTSSHLRLVFQTAYDTYPLDTRQWKLDHLPTIAAEPYLLMFDHDPALFGATLVPDERGGFTVGNGLPVNG